LHVKFCQQTLRSAIVFGAFLGSMCAMRFDVCAHTYDEHAGPQRFFAERVAQFIGAQPAETILELGAGTGALTQHLIGAPSGLAGIPLAGSETGVAILATDASPTMVERGCLAVPQVEWSVLDAFSHPPLPATALQVSSGLLHWAEDPVATLIRWRESLLSGGRMVHAMPCEPCLKEWRALVPESPVPWHNEAEWLKIFERAGLRVTRLQSWTHAAVCASALEMVRGFHRTGVTGRVHVGPARLRQALRNYDRQHRVPGGVASTWTWLAVEARSGRCEKEKAPVSRGLAID
jgi:trans-aconitate methyltransferase